MHLIYIDESWDAQGLVISALIIDAERWRDCLANMKSFRSHLRASYGIYVKREIHAREWTAGRGNVGSRVVPKGLRHYLYGEMLDMVATLPGAALINACVQPHELYRGFERLVNRLQVFLSKAGSYGILFCDEGKEAVYFPMLRKMGNINHIPSKYGGWGFQKTINIPAARILEDPVFLKSHSSWFVQYVDCCAYALLRHEFPLPSRAKYGLDQAWVHLHPICVTAAFAQDPKQMGIIRAHP